MEVLHDYFGVPPAPAGFGQPLHLTRGDVLELKKADVDFAWWEVKPYCPVCISTLCIYVSHISPNNSKTCVFGPSSHIV